MALGDIQKKGGEAISLSLGQPARPVLKAAWFLNRPILMGVAAFLSILGCCQAYGQGAGPSYGKPHYAALATSSSSSENGDLKDNDLHRSDALPLLFLTFVGLAGMALSRTKSSPNDFD
jgi:hypothetical protein